MSKPRKVLIIDDDPDDIELVREALERDHIECLSLVSPLSGLELIPLWKPDLILLDLILPSMSGYGVLRELKGNPEVAKIPIVVLSSLSDEEIAETSVDLGAARFLNKDCSMQELLSTVYECAA
jgi:two-component system sensor histidine kinase/response regulator